MSAEQLVLLLGLFGVPAALVWLGHGLRRRSAGWRGAFWGGVAGHTAALALTLLLTVLPPVWWEHGAWWRGPMVHFSLLLGGLLGAAAGYWRGIMNDE